MAQFRFSKALKNQWTSDSEEENETALSPTLGEENSYNSGRGKYRTDISYRIMPFLCKNKRAGESYSAG